MKFVVVTVLDNPHHWETLVASLDERAWLSKCSGLALCYCAKWRTFHNRLNDVLHHPGVASAFGFNRHTAQNRASAFFTRLCNFGYVFSGSPVRQGLPFPEVLFEMCALIMPVCGIYDKTEWPTGANVTWYQDG